MSVRKYSVMISGHRTSVSLEPEFYTALKDIAAKRGLSPAELITQIDTNRKDALSSSIRVFILKAVSGN